MSNEWFDDLTKAFVLRPTRREVLKTIAVTLAGLVIGPSCGPDCSGRGGDPNAIGGSCADYIRFLKECGVTNANGKRFPGAAGVTTFRFQVEPIVMAVVTTNTAGGQTCRNATVQMTVSTDPNPPVVRHLLWEPDSQACNVCGCQAWWGNYERRVLAHEDRHVNDALELASAGGQDWGTREIVGCGSDPTAADARLYAEIDAAAVQLRRDVQAKEQSRVELVDSGLTFFNCEDGCGRCSAGQISTNCAMCQHCDTSSGECISSCSGTEGCCENDGRCHDLGNEANNCGGCGRSCTPGQPLCLNGTCRGITCGGTLSCGPGLQCCGGLCVRLLGDPRNCGGCGRVCQPDETCCGNGCAPLGRDTVNCGSCGVHCNGVSCCGGTCCGTGRGCRPESNFGVCMDAPPPSPM